MILLGPGESIDTRVFQMILGKGNQSFLSTAFALDRRETLAPRPSKVARSVQYVLYRALPLKAWEQRKTQFFGKSKGFPAIRGKSCT